MGEIRDTMQDIKSRVKRKTPPMQDLEDSRLRIDKDPDIALQPGVLHYEISLRELDEWIASFEAYLANGKCVDSKTVIAYIRKFMDDDYCASQIPSQL